MMITSTATASTTKTATTTTKLTTSKKDIQAKIDSVISKDNASYGWLCNSLLSLPIQNVMVVCDYVIAMISEDNISESTRRNVLNSLTRFLKWLYSPSNSYYYHHHQNLNGSKAKDSGSRDTYRRKNNKVRLLSSSSSSSSSPHFLLPFDKVTRSMISLYLNSFRKTEEQDRTQKWIGSYNIAVVILQKFYKWLYSPNTRRQDRALPDQVSGFKKIRRKEMARYNASDLWTMDEHNIFLKYCPSPRIKAYHAMALDTSARPHELLNLRFKDMKERIIPVSKDEKTGMTRKSCVVFEFTVKGKTGTRGLAITKSVAYYLKWKDLHPQGGNKDAFVFASANSRMVGKMPKPQSLHKVYSYYYRKIYFPKLLVNPIPDADKQIIKKMLEERRWNPYVIRHGALTMKAKNRLMSDTMLRQHAGWSRESNMPSVYIHAFGNENVDELLRIEGYLPPEDNSFDVNPLGIMRCPNCNCANVPESISCVNCKMLLSSNAYHEIIQEQENKEEELDGLKKRMAEYEEAEKVLQRFYEKIDKQQQEIDKIKKQILADLDSNNNNKEQSQQQ